MTLISQRHEPFVMRTILIPTLLMSLCLIASIQKAGAQEYTITCNEDGYVVSPNNRLPLYLGRSCDAYNEQLGGGRWCWQQNDIEVDFARGASTVEGLSLPLCPVIDKSTVPCSCASNPL